MKLPLKQALKKHLDRKRLDAEQQNTLMALQQACVKRPPTVKPNRYAWVGGAFVLLAVSLSLVWLNRFSAPTNLVDEIAAEVVNNHLHMKPLEVNTAHIASIQDYFQRLNFKPVQSRYLTELGLTLLGGRYCSLQGVTAAQLRFKSLATDDIHTLYQVGHDPATFRKLPDYDRGEPPASTWYNGIKVTLWVEKGVLFALTEEPDSAGVNQ